ncbi:MAG: hypothetical protein WB810_01475 [Candidatus Cybelea sp.]
MPDVPTSLGAWSSFYVMTGSSAAALTGLMFVVISLVTGADGPRKQDGIGTFSTPIVMHFFAAFLISAILCAPWHSLILPGVSVALVGVYGLVYVTRIMFRTRRLSAYTADLEDWIWYIVMPFGAYGVVAAGAIAYPMVSVKALFAVGGGVVTLIFIGIRNAWDIVTYLALRGSGRE